MMRIPRTAKPLNKSMEMIRSFGAVALKEIEESISINLTKRIYKTIVYISYQKKKPEGKFSLRLFFAYFFSTILLA